MFVIKNTRTHPISVDGVQFTPGQQLSAPTLTPAIQTAIQAGDLSVQSGDETREERHADTEAFTPFKTGDRAIDG